MIDPEDETILALRKQISFMDDRVIELENKVDRLIDYINKNKQS